MLPITHHRVLHIPHGLAIGAAVVGLIVALSWDQPQPKAAELNATAPVMISMDDGSAATKNPGAPGREEPRGQEMLPGFGPLVLPFAPSR